MRRYVTRPPYESNNLEEIQATKSISIDLDTYDIENDPDGIFDVDSMNDDTSYSFDSYDEYKRYIALFDAM